MMTMTMLLLLLLLLMMMMMVTLLMLLVVVVVVLLMMVIAMRARPRYSLPTSVGNNMHVTACNGAPPMKPSHVLLGEIERKGRRMILRPQAMPTK